jgi:hypothetical protein
MDPHEVLNPQSLADECGLTLSRIHQLIRAETIQATRLGKWIYVIMPEPRKWSQNALVCGRVRSIAERQKRTRAPVRPLGD